MVNERMASKIPTKFARKKHHSMNKPEPEIASKQPEQPNTELLIVKTIQGLMSAANNQLRGLEVIETTTTTNEKLRLVRKALEDIDLFQRTTLNELQKAFE